MHVSACMYPHACIRMHVSASNWQPSPCSHISTSMCPPPAANQHVDASNWQPSPCSHISTSSRPSAAAARAASQSHGIPSPTAHLALSTDATIALLIVISALPLCTCVSCWAPRQVSAHASRSPSATWVVMAEAMSPGMCMLLLLIRSVLGSLSTHPTWADDAANEPSRRSESASIVDEQTRSVLAIRWVTPRACRPPHGVPACHRRLARRFSIDRVPTSLPFKYFFN
jgi:hypothetical protein